MTPTDWVVLVVVVYVFGRDLFDLLFLLKERRYRRFLAKRYSNKSTTPRRVKR